MTRFVSLCALVASFVLVVAAASADEKPLGKERFWTCDRQKQPYKSTLIDVDRQAKTVRLHSSDGQDTDLTFDRLSAADRQYISQVARVGKVAKTARPAKRAAGRDLVSQSGYSWHETPAGASAAALGSKASQKPILWFRHVGETDGPMCSASHRMRVVSFADPAVRKMIEEKFVPLSTNMEGMVGAGSSIGHMPNDSPGQCPSRFAHQNCQTLYLTPDLKVFHVATGFLPPEQLLAEMEFASELYNKLKKHPNDMPRTIADAEQRRLKQQGYQDSELVGASDSLGGMLSGFAGGQPNPANGSGDIFAGFARLRALEDGKYMLRYPLVSLADFERDPTPLVGNGKFAFQSVTNGDATGRSTGR